MATIEPNLEYCRIAPRWKKSRDAIGGEHDLKENDLSMAGVSVSGLPSTTTTGTSACPRVRYLRRINPADTTAYNTERNKDYINGAKFVPYPSRTVSGLTGLVFRVEPKAPEDLPKEMEYLTDNVDGTGLSMAGQSASFVSELLVVGNDGQLVDMPFTSGPVTIAQRDAGIRPSIIEYKAERIIDWRVENIRGVSKLTLLVLMDVETEPEEDDPLNIKRKEVVVYKIFRLTGKNVTLDTLREEDESPRSSVTLTGAKDAPLSDIPFTFVGSKNNSPGFDPIPIEGVVDLSIGIYQESANLAESSFQFSAGTPYIADDAYQTGRMRDNKDGKDAPVEMGPASMPILGTNGVMAYATPPSSNLPLEIKKEYKLEIAEVGAQIISEGGQAETAEAAAIKHASDVSVLSTITLNVGNAYSRSYGFCAEFLGVKPEKWVYSINRSFFDTAMTHEELRGQVEAWQGGAISKTVLDQNLIAGGVIDSGVDLVKMNNDIKQELSEAPQLDDGTGNANTGTD